LVEAKGDRLYSLIKFKGIDNRDYAEKLNGTPVFRLGKDTHSWMKINIGQMI